MKEILVTFPSGMFFFVKNRKNILSLYFWGQYMMDVILPGPVDRPMTLSTDRSGEAATSSLSIPASGESQCSLMRETSARFISTVGHYLLPVKTKSRASAAFVIPHFFLIRLTGFAVDLREM